MRHDPRLLPLPYNLKEVTFAFVALITDSETKALPVGGHSSQGTQGVEMGLLKMGKHYNCGLLVFFFPVCNINPFIIKQHRMKDQQLLTKSIAQVPVLGQ